MAKTYNGHPNWNHWNVSLWINNDEGLYGLARDCVRQSRRNRTVAVEMMLDMLQEMGTTHTPDGAPYSKTTIRHAMKEM
jgi:hypothetical protein